MNGKGKGPEKGRVISKYGSGHDNIDWRTEERKEADRKIKKTSSEWLNDPIFKGYQVLDPDGWRTDDTGVDYFYKKKITKDEFERRLAASTIKFPPTI